MKKTLLFLKLSIFLTVSTLNCTSLFTQYYAVIGDDTPTFYYLDISTNVWTQKANLPANLDKGGSLVYDGQYIYATEGGGTTNFYSYDIGTDTWTAKADTPSSVEEGGKMAIDGSSSIYLIQGGAAAGFFRYTIASNTWTTLAPVPQTVEDVGAITFDGTYIYAFSGGGQGNFYRYNTSTNSWTAMASITFSNKPDDGASLVYASGNYIYAIPAGDVTSKVSFYRYDISTNTWSDVGVADSPLGFGDGAALVYDGVGNIYSMRAGDASGDLMKYSISTNSWITFNGTIPVLGGDGGGGVWAGGGPAADLSLQVSPLTQSGNAGEFVSYTLTLTNAGPDEASNVKVKVNIPANGLYVSSSPQQGAYDSSTKLWDVGNVPVGNKTMTITLKVN